MKFKKEVHQRIPRLTQFKLDLPLPNLEIYIMLTTKKRLRITSHNVITLLLSFSLITFHSNAFAGLKEKTAEEYRAKGLLEQQKGNLNSALDHYTKAAALGLENPAVFNDMGILYEQIDFNSKAEQCYRKAIQTDKQYLPSYINLAYLYQKLGNPQQAFEYFKRRYELGDLGDPWTEQAKEELLKIRPEYIDWIVNREAQQFQQQLVEKAHREFYERVKRSSEHYQKGEDFFQKENYHQALKEFNQALALSPQDSKIIEARKKTILELSKIKIKEHSDLAIKMLNSGDSISAKYEIQKMLTAVPKEPMIISR